MDLASKALTVVSTDGSYFGVDSAYLVDLSSCSDDCIAYFQDGPDRNRAQVALDRGAKLTDILNDDEPPFVSKCLMYGIEGCVHDDNNPEFAYYIPCESGNFWMVDCWIVNEEGSLHPDYNIAGVPVATKNFVAIDDSPRIMG